MSKLAARFFSFLFHPLFFPGIAAAYIIAMNPYRFGGLDLHQKSLIVIVIFIITAIFPIFSILIMYLLKMIDSMHLANQQQRTIPYIAAATFYLWTYMMFRPGNSAFDTDALLAGMLLGSVISIFLGFFINIFSKISLHTMACGSLLGVIIFTAPYASYSIYGFLFFAIIVAGVVGTSRLILKAHTPGQIYFGYFIGFLGQFIPFRILM